MTKARRVLRPAGFPPRDRDMGYSYGLQVGDTIWVGGQIAVNERDECVGTGDAAAQTEQCFRNIASVLAEGGATLADIVSLTIFIRDASMAKAVQGVRRRMLGPVYPTAAMIVADFAIPEYLVEIQAVAVLER